MAIVGVGVLAFGLVIGVEEEDGGGGGGGGGIVELDGISILFVETTTAAVGDVVEILSFDRIEDDDTSVPLTMIGPDVLSDVVVGVASEFNEHDDGLSTTDDAASSL